MTSRAGVRERTIGDDVPSAPRSFRLSDGDIARLAELQRLLGRSQTETVSMAITHLLATLTRDERVYLTVPKPTDPRPE